jgi:hypothetical protein
MATREEEWERISALAGVDVDGNVQPPPVGWEINREPVSFWSNYRRLASEAMKARD